MVHRDEDSIESIDGISRKNSPAWWLMEGDKIQSFENYSVQAQTQMLPAVDTISSARLPRDFEEQVVKAKIQSRSTYSFDVTSVGKSIWNFFNRALTIHKTIEGTSNKPGGDSSTGLGSPSLEPPFQVDLKALEKLLKELKELNYQIKESTNETEEEINGKERSKQSIYALIEYLKMQKKVREESSLLVKDDITRGHNRDLAIRKEQGDADNIRIETEEKRKFWTNVNWYISIGAMVVTAALVATVAFSTFGAGLIAIPAMVQIGLSVTNCTLGLASGGSALVKTVLDKKFGELKEKTEALNGMHMHLSFNLKRYMEQMNSGWESAQKIAKELSEVLRNMRDATQAINAR